MRRKMLAHKIHALDVEHSTKTSNTAYAYF